MAFQYGMLMRLSIMLLAVLVPAATSVVATTRASARQGGADDGKAAMTKPNCTAKCGNVTIPYPFGIGDPRCYFGSRFQITCRESKNGSTYPRLMTSRMNVTNISLEDGELEILQSVNRDCYDADGKPTGRENQKSSGLWVFPPYTISGDKNRMFVVGCDTYAELVGSRGYQNYITGCISKCDQNPGDYAHSVNENDTCSGMGCCRTKIPPLLNYLTLTVGSYNNHSKVIHFNPCGYAFVVKKDNFTFGKTSFQDLRKTLKLPLVLDWQIGDESCDHAKQNKTTFACKGNNSICQDKPSGYICLCKPGFQGNPYLPDCKDINECENLNRCKNGKCENNEGNYTCVCDSGYKNLDDITCIKVPSAKPLKISLGVSLSFCVLLVATFWKYREQRIRHLEKVKQKYSEANGFRVLQETMDRLGKKAGRIFTENEVKQATENYDGSKKVGEGRYGIVYEGILKVGESKPRVAIKKSKVRVPIYQKQITSPNDDQKQNTAPIDEQITQQRFIKEMIALNQINHKNIVTFVGCCLDTAKPILVYEFMSEGTLYEHIHEKEGKKPLEVARRLKIAAETAEALAFLHHDTGEQIIHCDVKTDNILLDKNWTAKLSGFGASRLGPEDENQISTLVHGKVGYEDPEDLDSKSNTLTEKSDVYSFGVVLAELLTGLKPDRNLAKVFVGLVEGGTLDTSLDVKIVEGHFDIVRKAADLAKRCLKPKGEERPSMKEVAAKLNGLVRTMEQHPSGGGKADTSPSPKDTRNLGGSSASSASVGDTITSAE